jgi:unsaturated chondroitin disaccharide hydrolase
VQKIRRTMPRLADAPKTCAFDPQGNYFAWPEGFFEIGNWTSSFFTGMSLLAFESTHEMDFLKQVNRMAGVYHDKVHRHGMDTMHDLGFLYSLYSVALWKITGSSEQRALGLKAAEELAKRYVPSGEYIRAWGRMDDQATEYASQQTGNAFFHEIAVKHANTTAKYFVRPDDSVAHAYRFDARTGQAREDNYCGAAVGTHWARGTAWAIYGFTLAFTYTKDAAYIEIAQRLAKKFIAQLDAEVVPIWDFRRRPQDTAVRDASAASIAASAFYELSGHAPEGTLYREIADRLMDALIARYVDADLNIPGVVKNAQVGAGKSAYTSWGDYYFMEALARRLFQMRTYW